MTLGSLTRKLAIGIMYTVIVLVSVLLGISLIILFNLCNLFMLVTVLSGLLVLTFSVWCLRKLQTNSKTSPKAISLLVIIATGFGALVVPIIIIHLLQHPGAF